MDTQKTQQLQFCKAQCLAVKASAAEKMYGGVSRAERRAKIRDRLLSRGQKLPDDPEEKFEAMEVVGPDGKKYLIEY